VQIINCAENTASTAEDEAHRVLQQSDVSGIAFSNLLTGGRQSRELDLLVWTSSGRLVVVEVKGTSTAGRLDVFANAAWQINGQRAYFAGGPQPHRQAKTAASRVAKTLNYSHVQHPWIEWVVAISGPIELNQPTKVDNGWVCRVDQLAEFLSRPPAKVECSPELIEHLFSVFNVPRQFRDQEISLPPREVVYASLASPKQEPLPVENEINSRLSFGLSWSNLQRMGRFWPGPRSSWTVNRSFWMFLLVWYLGCVVVSQSVHLICVAEGQWPIQSGAVNALYLASFVLCGVVAYTWVRSGRNALENSIWKSSK